MVDNYHKNSNAITGHFYVRSLGFPNFPRWQCGVVQLLVADAMAAPHVDYDHVEQQGWAIVRGMFPPDLCARLRAATDDAVGATRPMERSSAPRFGMDLDAALAARTPVVDSENFRHTARQPIFDAALAEAAVAGGMVGMHERLYGAAGGLRLMQQMLVRTDADPVAVAAGRSDPGGWHMDTAFLPKHYATTPQTNVYHVLTALNDVPSGGAAFHIVPSGFVQSKAYTDEHLDELESLQDSDFRTVLRPRLLAEAVQDTSESVEILLGEGDSCVFDLMTTHSASSNCIEGYSRYVLFQTFFDISASYALLPPRGASALPKKYPQEFRDALPLDLHYLLDWDYPTDNGKEQGSFWGLSKEQLEERAAGNGMFARKAEEEQRPAAFRRATTAAAKL
jgi:hypothetical protein